MYYPTGGQGGVQKLPRSVDWQPMFRRFALLRAAMGVCILAAVLPASVGAESPERPVAQGRFFSQTAGGDGKLGFRITNEGGVRFWDEFQRLGGVDTLGYPVGRRFQKDGFTVQPMQKGLLQWRPEVGRA